jgi:phosphopantetheine--protein transferase-like protein
MAENDVRLSSLFTEKEIKYFNKFKDKQTHVAGAFCAKEAICKALKTGFNGKVLPREIEILHKDNGAPYAVLKGGAKQVFDELGLKNIDISISHDKEKATAICIVE